jgi:hypothetical protein
LYNDLVTVELGQTQIIITKFYISISCNLNIDEIYFDGRLLEGRVGKSSRELRWGTREMSESAMVRTTIDCSVGAMPSRKRRVKG